MPSLVPIEIPTSLALAMVRTGFAQLDSRGDISLSQAGADFLREWLRQQSDTRS